MSSVEIIPSPRALGITTLRSDLGMTLNIPTNYNSREPQSQFNLFLSSAYAMGCCGAATISGLHGIIQPKDKENVVLALYNHVIKPACITYYAIASTGQLKEAKIKDSETLLALLLELGLTEVFKSPNRNHGPNNMHLMVWDPTEAYKASGWDKYLWREKGRQTLPLSMKVMSEKERKVIFAQWKEINASNAKEELERQTKQREQERLTQVDGLNSLLYNRKTLSPKIVDKLERILRVYGYERKASVPSNTTIGFAQNPKW